MGCLQGNLINLPMFGKVKVVLHRPIPDGFKVKTASVTKKADGFLPNAFAGRQNRS
jgi:putative transposase